MITLKRCSDIGYYVFLLDVRFSFGLDLPLLLTELEALRVKSNAKILPPPSNLKASSAQLNIASDSKRIHQD